MRSCTKIQTNPKMHIRFAGRMFPLYRAKCVQLMVRELVDSQFSPDGLFEVLRRTVLARRNTRFRLVPEYNKAGQVLQVAGSRRCRLARKGPMRLVIR